MNYSIANVQPKVSIVIPVFNVEDYLVSCVESVLQQSYKNIEVILVDDGSTDKSGKICDNFSKDERVLCFHKKNGGVSSARNYGLAKATGEYVSFVDSDDMVTDDYVEKLVVMALSNGCQFCGMIKNLDLRKKYENGCVLDLIEEHNKVLEYLSCDAYGNVACIFKMEILKRNNIWYREDLTCSEDALFSREYLVHCRKIGLIHDNIYKCRVNLESLSHRGHEGYAGYYIEKLIALKRLCCKMQLTDERTADFLCTRAMHGLKISLNHYMSFWKDQEVVEMLIQKTIELFKPWITERRVDDKKLSAWYAFHKPLLNKKKVPWLVSLLKVERWINGFLIKVYRLGKKIIRR